MSDGISVLMQHTLYSIAKYYEESQPDSNSTLVRYTCMLAYCIPLYVECRNTDRSERFYAYPHRKVQAGQ